MTFNISRRTALKTAAAAGALSVTGMPAMAAPKHGGKEDRARITSGAAFPVSQNSSLVRWFLLPNLTPRGISPRGARVWVATPADDMRPATWGVVGWWKYRENRL